MLASNYKDMQVQRQYGISALCIDNCLLCLNSNKNRLHRLNLIHQLILNLAVYLI